MDIMQDKTRTPVYLLDWMHVCHGWMDRSFDPALLSERGREIAAADRQRTGGAFPDMAGRWMVRVKVPYGIRITVEKGRVDEQPWLTADQPWEAGCAWVTVIHEKDLYRCWYVCARNDPAPEHLVGDREANRRFGKDDARYVLCYAESRDGRQWAKPALGQYCFNGSRANNIACPYGKETAVFRDDSAPPAERYKCFDFDKLPDLPPGEKNPYAASGLFGAVSPDGLAWQRLPQPLIRYFCDTENIGYWDPELRKLVGYFRGHFFPDGVYGGRAIARAETDDFRNWPMPQVILTPGAEEAPCDDYYTNGFTPHPDDPSLRFFFASIYHRNSDLVDVRLAASRDGRVFNWVSREPIIECRPGSQWAASGIYAGPNLLYLPDGRLGLPLRCTSQAHNESHAAYYRDYQTPPGGLAWATWEPGRLAGIEAENLGEFFTMPQVFDGRGIEINARTTRAGAVELEIWEQVAGRHSRTIPGFTFADHIPFRGNECRAICRFKGQKDLAALRGKRLELRFRLSSAKIFSYRFAE